MSSWDGSQRTQHIIMLGKWRMGTRPQRIKMCRLLLAIIMCINVSDSNIISCLVSRCIALATRKIIYISCCSVATVIGHFNVMRHERFMCLLRKHISWTEQRWNDSSGFFSDHICCGFTCILCCWISMWTLLSETKAVD